MAQVARELLLHLADGGVSFALTHGASDLARAVRSDLDLVLGERPDGRLLEVLYDACKEQDLFLTNALHYEVPHGYYFILALRRAGLCQFLHLDCLYDPIGVNCYYLRSTYLLQGADTVDGIPNVSDPKRATYLAIKRAIKRASTAEQRQELVQAISACHNEAALVIEQQTGAKARDILAKLIRKTTDEAQFQQQLDILRRRLRISRWLRHGARACAAVAFEIGRIIRRVVKPTGYFIVLVGPDGCGKSTIAESLLRHMGRGFRYVARRHWRPGLLPKLRPTRLNTSPPQSATASTSSSTSYFGVAVSICRFVYYLVDFSLGYWFLLYPMRLRTTLIVVERYFPDVVVNPARYGFRVPRWLRILASYVVPNPDLIVLLTDAPDVIHTRKPELSTAEIESQLAAFGNEIRRWGRNVTICTNTSPDEVTLRIADIAIADLSARTRRYLGRSHAR